MKETEYTYAVAYTRTLENRMLKKADYESLLNARSAEDALRYLSDRGYGGGNVKTERILSAEVLLKEELAYTWNEVRSACPKGAPIEIVLYQNDFHNLKTILKTVFTGIDYRPLMLEPYTVSPDVFHRAVSEGKPEILPDIFKNAMPEAYRILAREGDGQLAEILLDKALFSAMNEIAKKSQSSFLIDWVDLNIAIMNMKIALRGVYSGKSKDFIRNSMPECKRINADFLADAAARDIFSLLQVFTQSSFEEAAKAARESTEAFDKWCDNELIKYLQAARYKIFGFEPILAFLTGKQFELQAVRIILAGVKSKVPAEILRGRQRNLYV